jgi:hypothetical protein
MAARTPDGMLRILGSHRSRFVTVPRNLVRVSTRAHRNSTWRRWTASCAVLALLWPALGPVPWLLQHAVHDHLAQAAHEHAHGAGSEHHHVDFDVPGSPLHPANHDCTPCQVLQCLAQCALLLPDPPRVPVHVVVADVPVTSTPVLVATSVAPPQPARGPPKQLG